MVEYNENNQTLTIHVTSDIGIGGWYGFTKQNIVNAVVQYPDAESITFIINNYGGDLAEALSIRSYLGELAAEGKKIKAHFVGFSASAATVMVMHPAIERAMDEYAYMLIHNARSAIWDGEAKDFRDVADDLDKFSDTITDIYVEVSGQSKPKIKALMDEGKWLSAKDVKKNGLVNEIVKGSETTAATTNRDQKFINQFPTMKMEKETPKKGLASAFNALIVAMGLQPNEIIMNSGMPPAESDEGVDEFTPPPPVTEVDDGLKADTPAPVAKIVYPTPSPSPLSFNQTMGRYFNFAQKEVVKGGTKVRQRVAVAKANSSKLNVVEAYYIKHVLGRDLPANCGCGSVPAALDHLDWSAISEQLGDQVVEVATNIVIDRFKATFGAYIPSSWGHVRDRIYTQLTASFGDFLQPWGCGFNPKGLASFDLQSNIPRAVKGDLTICDGLLAQTYFNYLLTNSYMPYEHPLAMWLAEQVIESAMVDVVKAFWFGVYNPANIDTPAAAALDCFDGIHTIVDNAITAGTVLPIPTGAYNALTNNATAMLEAFTSGFEPAWWGQSVVIYCSPRFAQLYAQENLNNCMSCTPANEYYGWTELQPLRIMHTNHFLVPTIAFGAGDRLLATIPGNILFMGGNPNEWQTIRTERNGRQICMYFDAVGGAAVQSLSPRFFAVNDQAAVPIAW